MVAIKMTGLQFCGIDGYALYVKWKRGHEPK